MQDKYGLTADEVKKQISAGNVNVVQNRSDKSVRDIIFRLPYFLFFIVCNRKPVYQMCGIMHSICTCRGNGYALAYNRN